MPGTLSFLPTEQIYDLYFITALQQTLCNEPTKRWDPLVFARFPSKNEYEKICKYLKVLYGLNETELVSPYTMNTRNNFF